jgi:hypothetical protein
VVPPASHKISRVSWYSGCQPLSLCRPLRDSHPLWCGFTAASSSRETGTVGPTTPVPLARGWFGLFPLRSPLLRESRLISFRRATEMFQFTHGLPPGLWIAPGVSSHHAGGVAPFGVSGFFACVQLPLNVSPVAASFVSFQRQGIHLVLCVACSHFIWVILEYGDTCAFLCFNSCSPASRDCRQN